MLQLCFKIFSNKSFIIFNDNYLDFLKMDTELELIKNHQFKKKQTKEYFELVDKLIKFAKINIIIYILACFIGTLRVIYLAIINIPINNVIFSTLPNSGNK